MTTENAEAAETTSKAIEHQLPPREDGESNQDYLRRLREENRRHRERASEFETRAKEAEAKLQDADKAKTDTQAQVEQLKAATRTQIAITKIETAASKEGLIDTDVLERLLNPGEFVFDDGGKITNATELVEKLKSAKPYLFGSQATASTEAAPEPADGKAKTAKDMSPAEWAAEMAKYNL